jgi:hypothetical protein
MADVLVNANSATVSSGGTSAPAAGTSESWTVTTAAPFPTLTGGQVFRVIDILDLNLTTGYEVMQVTASANGTGVAWTVTRGVEGTTPKTHTAGFTVVPVISSAALDGRYQQGPLTGDVTTVLGVATLVGTSNVEAVIRANTLNQMGAPTAALAMNSQKITALALGVSAGDAASIQQLPGVTAVTASGTFTSGAAGLYLIICIGGGGQGGGGSTPSSTINQAGSGGGGQGECKQQLMTLAAATGYTCTIGAGGTGSGTAGAVGGHAGTAGGTGGNTTFAGPSNLIAGGGGGGAGASASSTTTAGLGGQYGGAGAMVVAAQPAGTGGFGAAPGGFLPTGSQGGSAVGFGAGGGGGSGGANGTNGGGGGGAGAFTAAGGGAGGSSGGGTAGSGSAGTAATAGQYGAGGGAGGPATTAAGTAGVGGAGAAGVILVIGPLV